MPYVNVPNDLFGNHICVLGSQKIIRFSYLSV